MSALDRLACALGRRDKVPNQELARELAANRDAEGIDELVAGLQSRDTCVRSDCIKALYEVGYLAPELIAGYAEEFLALLQAKNNRLVWGGMIALSTIAALRPEFVVARREEIERAIDSGAVITGDAGVKALAEAANTSERRALIAPYLLAHLETCRAKDVAAHAEKAAMAFDASSKDHFVALLQRRMDELTPPQQARARRVMREAEKR